MSGGRFGYVDSMLKNKIFGLTSISELTYEECYLRAKSKFKKKWLDNRGIRVKYVVDKAVRELQEELYKTYCIMEECTE